MKVTFYWHSYKYFPYELELARYELLSLTGNKPIKEINGLSVECPNNWQDLVRKTTYFREAVSEDGISIIPIQAILEASANGDKKSILNNEINRQSTRYSAHGIHEYRGKFNPQIVRVLGNILGIQTGEWVLDPFCGSGTLLLEATHIGWNAIGIDLNPLAVKIAKAKIAALKVPLEDLKGQTDILIQNLNLKISDISFEIQFTESQINTIGGHDWQSCLPCFNYLSSWFKESVLVQISVIINEVSKLPSEDIRLFLSIILSDIIRDVSLQSPADLRIRHRKDIFENIPVIPMFISSLRCKLNKILEARKYIVFNDTIQDAYIKDIKHIFDKISKNDLNLHHRFNASITSPPYATALPYIDTQRLSLVLLRLIDANELRNTEKLLIGNREITKSERLKIEEDLNTSRYGIQEECLKFCLELKNSINIKSDGFRRFNMPSLIYKYFSDMQMMFKQTHQLLKPNAPYALVIGRNFTKLGGRRFLIDTPHFLTLLAQENGFNFQEKIELNTYQRYDIHKNNSINSEALIILRNK